MYLPDDEWVFHFVGFNRFQQNLFERLDNHFKWFRHYAPILSNFTKLAFQNETIKEHLQMDSGPR